MKMDISSIIAAILGGLAGAGITIYFQKKQAMKEYRSLILSFASELVLTFARCVKYYEQSKEREISFSGLFDFTDASILSKFAAVTDKPEIVFAIIDLKSKYFQVRRHSEDAARYAAQASRTAKDRNEKNELMRAASHAQGVAMAFFTSPYADIVRETQQILDATKEISDGIVADDLFNRFSEACKKKEDIDKMPLKTV